MAVVFQLSVSVVSASREEGYPLPILCTLGVLRALRVLRARKIQPPFLTGNPATTRHHLGQIQDRQRQVPQRQIHSPVTPSSPSPNPPCPPCPLCEKNSASILAGNPKYWVYRRSDPLQIVLVHCLQIALSSLLLLLNLPFTRSHLFSTGLSLGYV